jgi:hypothetical protein
MSEDLQKQTWYQEFKKLNSTGPSGAAPPPEGRTERRQFARFCMHDVAAKLYRRGATALFGLAGLNIEGQVLDLSEGGLRLETSEKFLIDTKLRLKLNIAKFGDSLEADGVTRWCHATPRNPEIFHVGIKFTYEDPGNNRKIVQLRGWYTSAQYKSLRDTQLRQARNKKP